MKLPHLTWARAGYPTLRSGCGLRACRPHPLPGVGPQVSLLMLYPPWQLCILKKEEEELEEEECQIPIFTSHGAYVAKLRYHSDVIYSSIGNQAWNTMVVFKMCDSVPSARYSSVCNVLRLGRISLIPTYRV